MLQIKNLSVNISEDNTEILKNIDFSVKEGEIHAILGPNGSGKTTFGRTLLGDKKYKITKGEILLNNEKINELETHERSQKGLFISFQSPPEIDGVSLKDFLFAAKKSLDKTQTSFFKLKKSLEKYLEILNLDKSFLDREVNKGFSGGEKRKIEMLMMMILNPPIVFLDEIDSGIDVDSQRIIANFLQNFNQKEKKSLIIISHTEKFLREINPTHIHILIDGEIIKSGGRELLEKVHTDGFGEFS